MPATGRKAELEDGNTKKYPVARVILFSLMGIILLWIIIGMSFSVGYSVFWERNRANAIPDTIIDSIENQKVALRCSHAIKLFHSELAFQIKRSISRYPKKPSEIRTYWNRWHDEWRRDFSMLKKRYRFLSSPSADNDVERKLGQAYKSLNKLEANYNELINSTFPQFDDHHDKLGATLLQIEMMIQADKPANP